MMKQHDYAIEDAEAKRFLRLARQFENLAETYREVRLHGPANDAEAWKGMSLTLAESSKKQAA